MTGRLMSVSPIRLVSSMPVRRRHLVVGDEQIVVLLKQGFPGLLAVRSGRHIEARVGKDSGHELRIPASSSATRILRVGRNTALRKDLSRHEFIFLFSFTALSSSFI